MNGATAVKERPILFSGEMVRAIPDGRKTQTRRLNGLEEINHRPDEWTLHQVGTLDYMTRKPFRGRFGAYFHSETIEPGALSIAPVVCPYGRPGDRLWVREAWALVPRTAYAASEGVQQTIRPDDPYDHDAAVYRAGWDRCRPGRWRPSIHMPRWASRITLEITGVRVERVNEITERDALAEGIERSDWEFSCEPYRNYHEPRRRPGRNCASAVRSFNTLWDSINAARGYGWDANPWVWVIEFRPLSGGAHA